MIYCVGKEFGDNRMKFDMHCHTKEGSLDSKVPVEEYARQFSKLGYDGFMIADHNSYRGCWAWDAVCDDPEYADMTVIRGMEYDTKDAGHILVVLPDGVYPKVMKLRGMRLRRLILIVHSLGGVLGPAHPYGVPTSSMMGFKKVNRRLLNHVDFIEVFNTCELPMSNRLAKSMAERYHLPGIAGSDCHVTDYIGMAYTEINHQIYCNNDFIRAIKNHATIEAGGKERIQTLKGKYKDHWIGQTAYRIYNRGIGKLRSPRRGYHQYKLSQENRHIRHGYKQFKLRKENRHITL